MITIIAIGKKHESWIREGVERYEKRLTSAYRVKWILLPHSPHGGLTARQDESQSILTRLSRQDFVILLDETGKTLDSPSLASLLEDTFSSAKPVVIIIGGAYGVDGTIKDRADAILSLSPLVFPHQLVRLIIAEQLYRAQQISLAHPYHHQ